MRNIIESRGANKMQQLFLMGIIACLTFAAPITAEAGSGSSQRLPVLMYHSVLGEDYYAINANNPFIISEEAFAVQMRYLYYNGYTTITAAQLIDFLYNDKELPDRAVMLTFDDGYLDNVVFAHPIMKRYGFTGIIFVITSRLTEEQGTVKAYPLQYMSVEDMKNTTDVFEYGSHTDRMHHPVNGAPLTLRSNVEEIRADLRRSFEYPLTFRDGFAYPHGRFNDNVISALRAEGVRFAFTTQPGYVHADSSPLALNRFNISGDMSRERFSEIAPGRIDAMRIIRRFFYSPLNR
jgi:peptidoglycan/xylan/chitin deacetylase (PgdA/CDA1 family)